MKSRIILYLLVSTFLLAAPAAAHRVNLFADGMGDKIAGEGYFSGGGPCMGCRISLGDAAGKLLAETKTDKDGRFSLAKPQGKPPYTLAMEAGGGHKATFRLSAKDLGLVQADPSKAAKTQAAETSARPAVQTASAQPAGGGISPAQLEKALEKALAKELSPRSTAGKAMLKVVTPSTVSPPYWKSTACSAKATKTAGKAAQPSKIPNNPFNTRCPWAGPMGTWIKEATKKAAANNPAKGRRC